MGRINPITIIVALVLAAVATWGASKFLIKEKEPATKSQQITTAPVLIMKTDLAAGKRIDLSHVTTAAWPQDKLPLGRVESIKGLTGMVTATPMYAGEVIMANRLIQKGPGPVGGLSTLVPRGFRAITIRVDETIGVGGFVEPGDRVDVLVSLTGHGQKKDPSPRTITVLQDVPVLAVDNRPFDPDGGNISAPPIEEEEEEEEGPRGPTAIQARIVTLQVSSQQGERLVLASTTGRLILTLRNKDDSNDITSTDGSDVPQDLGYTPGISLSKLLNNPDSVVTNPVVANPVVTNPVVANPVVAKTKLTKEKPRAKPRAKPKAKPKVKRKSHVVEVIKGNKRSSQKF